MGRLVYSSGSGKRRGENLPARLRFAARRGVTLVELMIAMLILTLVCIAWLEIIGIQSARKEARRREAVERLAGMMDAFMYSCRSGEFDQGTAEVCFDGYQMVREGDRLFFKNDNNTSSTGVVHPLFENGESPIGYQLCIVEKTSLPNAHLFTGWDPESGRWLVGQLYEHNGSVEEAGKPFFTLPVYLYE